MDKDISEALLSSLKFRKRPMAKNVETVGRQWTDLHPHGFVQEWGSPKPKASSSSSKYFRSKPHVCPHRIRNILWLSFDMLKSLWRVQIVYSPYHGYRRYSGIFNYRRCLSGVWQKPFQIEDITRFQSSSNDQKSKNKPFNLGMICAISSICFFVQLPFFVVFPGQCIKSIEHGRPDPGDYSAATVPK